MGHIAPVINKVPHGHGTYNPAINKVPHGHVTYSPPCPCGTLFIAGAICPMPMWNFIYCRSYMSHAHVELYLL
jgi:hypothetical protein